MNFNDHLSLAQDRMSQIGVSQMIEALQKPGAIVRRGSFYDGGPACVQVCYPGAKFNPSIVESQIPPALASEIEKIENKPTSEPAHVVAPSVQAEPIQLGLFDVAEPEPVKQTALHLLPANVPDPRSERRARLLSLNRTIESGKMSELEQKG